MEGLSSRVASGYTVSLSTAEGGGEQGGADGDSSQPDGDSSEEPEGVNYALSWTIQFQRTGTECQYQLISIHIGGDTETDGITQQIADPLPPLEDEDDTTADADSDFDDNYEDPGIVYTRAELSEMLQEQEQTIRDLDLQLRQSKLDYKKLENELNN
ncbi:MAG: hypothetical protein LUG65_06740, partial [Clostridiales bacterium]|nr:hypothetical protein [Clostridiales bacterium]